GAGDWLAVGAGAGKRDGARLAVGRNGDAARESGLAVFLVLEGQGAGVDFLVSPRIGAGVAGNRVVFAVKFASPLAVSRTAFGVGAVGGNFHAVAGSLVYDGGVFRTIANFGFCFVQ